MLSAKNLKITFNPGTPIETRALRGLSLDIPAGQFVTVIGSNGAGKSTFLNAVSGDLPIDSGQILIDDEDVTRKPVWARANRVARVFQDPMAGTCEDLTIEENMALAQRRGTGRASAGRCRHRCATVSGKAWRPSASAWRTASATASACSPAASARPSAC